MLQGGTHHPCSPVCRLHSRPWPILDNGNIILRGVPGLSTIFFLNPRMYWILSTNSRSFLAKAPSFVFSTKRTAEVFSSLPMVLDKGVVEVFSGPGVYLDLPTEEACLDTCLLFSILFLFCLYKTRWSCLSVSLISCPSISP